MRRLGFLLVTVALVAGACSDDPATETTAATTTTTSTTLPSTTTTRERGPPDWLTRTRKRERSGAGSPPRTGSGWAGVVRAPSALGATTPARKSYQASEANWISSPTPPCVTLWSWGGLTRFHTTRASRPMAPRLGLALRAIRTRSPGRARALVWTNRPPRETLRTIPGWLPPPTSSWQGTRLR